MTAAKQLALDVESHGSRAATPSEERYELPTLPGVYVVVDKTRPAGGGFGPARLRAGHGIRVVHVISTHAGGEIRGYWLVDGERALELRHPASPRDWPELDVAVAAALGRPVTDRGTR